MRYRAQHTGGWVHVVVVEALSWLFDIIDTCSILNPCLLASNQCFGHQQPVLCHCPTYVYMYGTFTDTQMLVNYIHVHVFQVIRYLSGHIWFGSQLKQSASKGASCLEVLQLW